MSTADNRNLKCAKIAFSCILGADMSTAGSIPKNVDSSIFGKQRLATVPHIFLTFLFLYCDAMV